MGENQILDSVNIHIMKLETIANFTYSLLENVKLIYQIYLSSFCSSALRGPVLGANTWVPTFGGIQVVAYWVE